jgi:hypothetical protein
VVAALASTRRAVALDRYGIAAHVLATRDGCTASKCAAFALVDDPGVLKANLRAQVFDQYVSRYAAGWNAQAPPAEKPPPAVSAVLPAAPPVAGIASPATGTTPTAAVKPGEPWDFPSAASIPPVSIMNSEPPPKGADASAKVESNKPQLKGSTAPSQAGPAAQAAPPMPPVPPKRPQSQAAPSPAH